jgi:hypothetical protein
MGRPGLSNHRKFKRLAHGLGSVALARGVLELIWDSAYEAGNEYLGTAEDVELAASWNGDPGRLCALLVSCGGPDHPGFIEEVANRPGHFIVHDLWHHAPQYVSRRRQRELGRQQNGDPMAGESKPKAKRRATVG